LALVITAAVLGAVSRPYFAVAAGGRDTIYTLTRLFEETPTRLDQLGSLLAGRLGAPAAFLAVPGALAALLSRADAITRRRVLILAAWIVAACVLATGPTLRIGGTDLPMPDRLLDRWAPGFAALRDRRRLFVVAPVALGVLAGFGIVALAGATRRRGLLTAVLAGIALAATAVRMDLGPCRLLALPTGEQVPPVYRALARREHGPVLELPVSVALKEVPSATQQTWYEYFSIFHWRPLVNGYASYWPPSFEVIMAIARGLPAPRALDNLAACTGVRWIVAHTSLMSARERDAFLAGAPGLRPVERFGDDLLLEVSPHRSAGACVDSLRSPSATTTVEGTPLAPLQPAERVAAIESIALPAKVALLRRPTALAVPVRLRNVGAATWPAVALDDTHLVRLSYAWRDAAGPVDLKWRLWTRLPIDLRPGESIEVPVAVRLPPRAGDYRLEIVVRQGLQGSFDVSGHAAAPIPVDVR
jgi:hypothetical protein